jgi:hypothetical protein
MARMSMPSNRPFAHVGWVAAAACVQLAVLLWAARAHIEQALNCDVCDTFYYYNAAAAFADTGLLFSNPYDGYRSYFAPLVIAAVTKLASGLGFGDEPVVRYAYGVAIVFWLASLGLMIWLARRAAPKDFILITVATLLNPFLIVYVPFALQEGVLLLCCLPLLFLWIAAKDWHPARRAALVLAMAVLAYVIRAALVWWLIPAAAYAGWLLWRRRDAGAWLRWMTAILIGAFAVIGPQVYISKQHFNSFNPYPSTTVFSQQIPIGITLLKFATVEDEGHWRGLTFWSPYVAEPEEEKTFANFYVRHPARGAFLMLAHAYAGFHYDQLMPYWHLGRARPFTIWLALSSAIVFLGVVRMTAIVGERGLDPDRAFAIATLVLSAASLVFVAAESRFGIIGFAMLSITVAEWVGSRPTRSEWLRLAPALLLYLVVSFLYNTLLLQSADVNV